MDWKSKGNWEQCKKGWNVGGLFEEVFDDVNVGVVIVCVLFVLNVIV